MSSVRRSAIRSSTSSARPSAAESLRDLLIEAVRYGEQPEVKQNLKIVVDATVGEALRRVVHDRALVSDVMTAGDVERIREEMERAEARKLQPHFIRSFFLTAFAHIGGVIREREPGRFEISNVPAELRRRDRQIGMGAPLLRRYERVTFEKGLIAAERGPLAEYVTPGHPLLDGTIDLIIERYDSLLRQGAVLIDENDPGMQSRMCSSTCSIRWLTAGPTRPVTAGSSPSASSSSASTPRAPLTPPGGLPTWISVQPPPDEIEAFDACDRWRMGPR